MAGYSNEVPLPVCNELTSSLHYSTDASRRVAFENFNRFAGQHFLFSSRLSGVWHLLEQKPMGGGRGVKKLSEFGAIGPTDADKQWFQRGKWGFRSHQDRQDCRRLLFGAVAKRTYVGSAVSGHFVGATSKGTKRSFNLNV